MSNLTTQTKYVNVCIRKLSYPHDFEAKLREYVTSQCSTYSYIKHEHDINGYGEVEGLHYHLVLVYKERSRLVTFLNRIADHFGFANSDGIEIGKTISTTNSIQYLIHKNNPEKTQHKVEEIVTSYPIEELKTIIDSQSDTSVTFEYIYKLIMDRPSKLYLIQCLGINTYKNYRSVILDMIEEVKNNHRI